MSLSEHPLRCPLSEAISSSLPKLGETRPRKPWLHTAQLNCDGTRCLWGQGGPPVEWTLPAYKIPGKSAPQPRSLSFHWASSEVLTGPLYLHRVEVLQFVLTVPCLPLPRVWSTMAKTSLVCSPFFCHYLERHAKQADVDFSTKECFINKLPIVHFRKIHQ